MGVDLNRVLPNDPKSAAVARAAIRDFLRAAGVPALIEDAELVASELVSNAVRHASGPVGVSVRILGDHLHLEVSDASVDDPPRPQDPAADEETGRGLIMVSKVASRWGWRRAGPVKIVWLDLPIRR